MCIRDRPAVVPSPTQTGHDAVETCSLCVCAGHKKPAVVPSPTQTGHDAVETDVESVGNKTVVL